MARSLGVGWWSVMRAVVEVGRPMVDDPARLADVSGLGVDEHAWQRANAVRHTQYATGVVGLRAGRPARLLEVVEGRSGGVYGDWLAQRPEDWREQISVAALDPFRGYLVRHEAPCNRVGCKDPPPVLSQQAGEAEGSLTPGGAGVGREAALTTPGRVGTARRPGSGKQGGEV